MNVSISVAAGHPDLAMDFVNQANSALIHAVQWGRRDSKAMRGRASLRCDLVRVRDVSPSSSKIGHSTGATNFDLDHKGHKGHKGLTVSEPRKTRNHRAGPRSSVEMKVRAVRILSRAMNEDRNLAVLIANSSSRIIHSGRNRTSVAACGGLEPWHCGAAWKQAKPRTEHTL